MHSNENNGVITLDVQIQRCLSRKSLIRIELGWQDMRSLPISGDRIPIDRHELLVTEGPVSDEALLDRPSLVADGVWKCDYPGEWVHAEALARAFKKDWWCRSVRLLP